MDIIDLPDLPESLLTVELIEDMVAGANAKAARVAPCLAGEGADAPTAGQVAEARLVLLGAVKRWAEAGSGAFQQQTAGIFSATTDTRQRSGFNLWPSEIESLQDICRTGHTTSRAYEADMIPASSPYSPLYGLG